MKFLSLSILVVSKLVDTASLEVEKSLTQKVFSRAKKYPTFPFHDADQNGVPSE